MCGAYCAAAKVCRAWGAFSAPPVHACPGAGGCTAAAGVCPGCSGVIGGGGASSRARCLATSSSGMILVVSTKDTMLLSGLYSEWMTNTSILSRPDSADPLRAAAPALPPAGMVPAGAMGVSGGASLTFWRLLLPKEVWAPSSGRGVTCLRGRGWTAPVVLPDFAPRAPFDGAALRAASIGTAVFVEAAAVLTISSSYFGSESGPPSRGSGTDAE
mmetsp:Transcript_53897/g.161263  ORF Transcript_53897/g.161263 Transcript_53897/m.161263 type:complete len:215 (-) Transcript_53897:894-1538(-)